MKAQLNDALLILEALKGMAEDMLDNTEREATIERYENICSYLDEAISSIESAIDEYDN